MSTLRTRIFSRIRTFGAPMLRPILERSAVARWLLLKTLAVVYPPVTKLDGHTIHLQPDDLGVSFEIRCSGEYESMTRKLFVETLKPNMTVFDVGAHVGIYTLAAARAIGDNGHVIAFEPDTTNANLLRKNVSLNNYNNITVHQAAVSDSCEPLTLYRSAFNTGDHQLFSGEKHREEISVDCISIDAFIEEHNIMPDIIKMDIQGAEAAALRGAAQLLDSTHPLTIFLEHSPYLLQNAGEDPEAILKQLAEAGFRFHNINEHTGAVTKGTHEEIDAQCVKDGYTNILCVRS